VCVCVCKHIAKFHYTDTDTDTDPTEFRRKKVRVRVRVVEFSSYHTVPARLAGVMATRWPSWTARGVPLPARTNGADAITSTVALTECTPSLTRTVVLASPEPARCCADTGVDKAGGGQGAQPPQWPGKFFLLK